GENKTPGENKKPERESDSNINPRIPHDDPGSFEGTPAKPGSGAGTKPGSGAGTNSQQGAGTKPGSGAGTNSQQ
ncbi:hypothetical protein JL679_04325, partial [Mycoplasmopsis bovis]|nr:hypothetical protein [Mycoplasmopsis bovis]